MCGGGIFQFLTYKLRCPNNIPIWKLPWIDHGLKTPVRTSLLWQPLLLWPWISLLQFLSIQTLPLIFSAQNTSTSSSSALLLLLVLELVLSLVEQKVASDRRILRFLLPCLVCIFFKSIWLFWQTFIWYDTEFSIWEYDWISAFLLVGSAKSWFPEKIGRWVDGDISYMISIWWMVVEVESLL